MNHLDIAPPGGAHRQEDSPANATADRLMVGGNPVYSAYFEGGMGYRINHGNGTAVADEPETMYMVTSGACGRAGERAGVGSITFSGGGCGVFLYHSQYPRCTSRSTPAVFQAVVPSKLRVC